jgi:hypothetical protein
MPTTTPITTPAIPPSERPDFDAEEVELTVVVAELAVFVVGLAERLCEEKVEKEDKDVLVPRTMVEMISGVPGSSQNISNVSKFYLTSRCNGAHRSDTQGSIFSARCRRWLHVRIMICEVGDVDVDLVWAQRTRLVSSTASDVPIVAASDLIRSSRTNAFAASLAERPASYVRRWTGVHSLC